MAEARRPPRAAIIPLVGVLCATAGSVDAIAYILFGKIFIANMTGNTVLFAVSIASRDWKQAGLRIGVVFAFLAGIMLAHAVLARLTHAHERQTRLTTLGIEFVLLSVLTWVSHMHTRVLLLVLLAVAMGAQNDAFRTIGGIRLNTAFITGDLEDFGAAVADLEACGKLRRARRRAAVFLSIWITYAIGGLLGAFGAFRFHEKALWFPAALLVLAAAMVIHSPRRAARNDEAKTSGVPGLAG